MSPIAFRQESLEELNSPERLDRLMVLVKPRAWIALSACLVGTLAGLAWGIFGKTTEQAIGHGVMEPAGGLSDLDAPASGEVLQVLARVGSLVAKGDPVVRIIPDDLVKKVQETQHRLRRLRLEQADLQAAEAKAGKRSPLDRQIRTAEAELALEQVDLGRGMEVRSTLNGRIAEILVDAGERVAGDTPMIRMDNASAPTSVYLFIPTHGMWLSPGNEVELEVTGFPREEFGSMVGVIRRVSPTPQSLEAVAQVTRNRLMAARFAGAGDAYRVEVVPERDPDTVSGYRWTNGKGPKARFGTGSLVTGRIKLRQRPPILEVIPALRKWIGGS